MKYILAITCSFILFACTPSTESTSGDAPSSKVVHMTPQEFQAKMVELGDVQLVDVRTAGEVADGYLAGSKNMDIKSSDFGTQIKALDKDKPVMVYCAAGGRSKRACNSMKDWGFTEIYELDSGFGRWESAGLPVAK
ncbi:MAG: thioredoxin 1 [Maribacter sp.]|jgi:thioredoxin 1